MTIRHFICYAAAGVALALAAPAAAQNYDLDIYNVDVGAEPVDQSKPSYPSRVRRGQEGWVSVNYVITADGKAVDPVILDSVGGAAFEESVREAVARWRFEAPGEELANNLSNIRFEIHDGRDMATSNFLRRYRQIMRHLYNEDNAMAREALDGTLELGGWNLYESTMLWLMAGRVAGAEGDSAGKLEHYRRALGVSNANSLKDDDLRDLLTRIFGIEMELGQYASARQTLAHLRDVPGSERAVAALSDQAAELERKLAADDPLTARGQLFNPAGTEEGVALWAYAPSRRTFSFAALNGNVERFEVRCERDRFDGSVEAGKPWSLPDGAGDCRVLVFGDDGASFDFVEHSGNESIDATARTAVARSDVLD